LRAVIGFVGTAYFSVLLLLLYYIFGFNPSHKPFSDKDHDTTDPALDLESLNVIDKRIYDSKVAAYRGVPDRWRWTAPWNPERVEEFGALFTKV